MLGTVGDRSICIASNLASKRGGLDRRIDHRLATCRASGTGVNQHATPSQRPLIKTDDWLQAVSGEQGQLPFAARVRPPQHEDAAVAAAQSWIAENYAAPNPVAGMTGISGLATRTFKRRFEAATDYTALDYVQSLRIEEAKQMLETSDRTLQDVGPEVGYTEPAAFRRLFKRKTGITPQQYRQRFRWISVMG